MYKRVLNLLLCVALMPALILGVNAKDLVISSVDNYGNLPLGYVYQYTPTGGYGYNTVVIYDFLSSMYFCIDFTGRLQINTSNGFPRLHFWNPGSVSVRAYECTGRNIFDYIDGQNFTITLPPQKIAELVTPAWRQDISTTFMGSNSINLTGNNNSGFVSLSGNTTINGNNSGSAIINIPKGDINLTGLNLDVDIDDFAIKGLDYYRVRSSSDSVETNIDYKDTYRFGSGGLLYVGAGSLNGHVVALTMSDNATDYSSALVHYNTSNVYYRGSSLSGKLYLVNYDLLSYVPLPFNILERYLNHFGYSIPNYSEDGSSAESGLDDIGGGLGSAFDDMAGFEDSANKTINDVTGSITQVGAISNKIWGIMPVWFWGITSVYLIFLVGRKIIGR